MKNNPFDDDRVRQDEELRELKKLHGDEQYARRYLAYVQDQQVSGFTFFALILIVVGIFVFLYFGLISEFLIGCFVIGCSWKIVTLIQKGFSIHKQDQMYNETVERQNGIDRRWGRTGAEGKKKNA